MKPAERQITVYLALRPTPRVSKGAAQTWWSSKTSAHDLLGVDPAGLVHSHISRGPCCMGAERLVGSPLDVQSWPWSKHSYCAAVLDWSPDRSKGFCPNSLEIKPAGHELKEQYWPPLSRLTLRPRSQAGPNKCLHSTLQRRLLCVSCISLGVIRPHRTRDLDHGMSCPSLDAECLKL